MNVLDIDPQNLRFDFGGEWARFRESRVKRFLALHLQHRIDLQHLALEQADTLEVVKAVQGAIAEARHILAVLNSQDVSSQVNDIINGIK